MCRDKYPERVAVWEKMGPGWSDKLCDECFHSGHLLQRQQMEYKWLGSEEDNPHHVFTCQPGNVTNVFKHADPCTCGEEIKSIVDDLETGIQAIERYRAIFCRERGGPITNNIGWDDMDPVKVMIGKLEDKILVNRARMSKTYDPYSHKIRGERPAKKQRVEDAQRPPPPAEA